MYKCIYIYVHIYTYLYIFICIYICTYIYCTYTGITIYSQLQMGWHRILILFLKFCQHTIILPMVLWIVNISLYGTNYESHENSGAPGTKLKVFGNNPKILCHPICNWLSDLLHFLPRLSSSIHFSLSLSFALSFSLSLSLSLTRLESYMCIYICIHDTLLDIVYMYAF